MAWGGLRITLGSYIGVGIGSHDLLVGRSFQIGILTLIQTSRFSYKWKNIGKNPIVDCERNGERIENNRIENEMKVQLENGNKSPFTNWKYNSN